MTHNPRVSTVLKTFLSLFFFLFFLSLFSCQGVSGSQSTEELIKQPDFSDKIKQLLGSLQQTQNQGAHAPGMALFGSLSIDMLPVALWC